MDKNSASAAWYRSFPRAWPKPKAIVIISAHWEESGAVTVTSGESPPLIYDYYGFPAETYELKYPAPGDPALAAEIAGMLNAAGVAAKLDSSRGFDHGMFIPLKLMYPDADVPVVQVSLLSSLDSAAHIAIGAALAPLAAPGRDILLVGSGQATHNLRTMDPSQPAGQTSPREASFLAWLKETVTAAATAEATAAEDGSGKDSSKDGGSSSRAAVLSAAARRERLEKWERLAPHARYVHPREEHLMPLHVVEGYVGFCPGRLMHDRTLLGTLSLMSFEFA
ncbi:unnamed protein product [Phaeothamnion confervicola]